MKLSTDRILTTHVGSLPRPDDLLEMLLAKETGEGQDAAAFDARVSNAVEEIVAQQVELGVDAVSDGEMSKLSYTFYVRHRLDGVGEAPAGGEEEPDQGIGQDFIDHPDYYARMKEQAGNWYMRFKALGCIGPIAYGDPEPLDRDLARFKTAVDKAKPVDAFMNAASPGVLTKFVPDAYYKDEDAYVEALSNAMKVEYEAIHKAGFVLQIDCPDLASARHNQYRRLSDEEFLRIADRNVEAINAATAEIPSEAMRMHLCWGNYEGPHTHDIAIAKILPVIGKARPQAVSFEGANPRHEHEWEDLKGSGLRDDQIVIPGVIDSTTNFVEHPRVIAQRLCRYADVVGRERVIAGGDCGFSTFAGLARVAPSVVWAKFRSLVEGARMASDRLWG